MIGVGFDHIVKRAVDGPVVRVVVIATAGSTPREVGAAMLVTASWSIGTIGGGALEHDVIARARAMLMALDDTPWQRGDVRYHLGPELNQCCGGSVRVLMERLGTAEYMTLATLSAALKDGATAAWRRPLRAGEPLQFAARHATTGLTSQDGGDEWFVEARADSAMPLVIYGAGHVGRALVKALADLPFLITWAETTWELFPAVDRDKVASTILIEPRSIAAHTTVDTGHLVMTHSHVLDEEIVTAVLQSGQFAYLGLIGSATKRARFQQRLSRAGVPADSVARMNCPIGLPGITGKAPAIIAASVVADLLMRRSS